MIPKNTYQIGHLKMAGDGFVLRYRNGTTMSAEGTAMSAKRWKEIIYDGSV